MAAFFGRRTPDVPPGPTGQRNEGTGLPGIENQNNTMNPQLAAMLLNRGTAQSTIGLEDIRKAATILQEYKDGKANLEQRVIQDELWWELRHWESIGRKKKLDDRGMPAGPEPTSAWLFNSIVNKHADAMDNYPEPVTLPRERSDADSAKILSEVLPVILEYNDFEKTYSDNWWEKLKHGTAAYGIFWNPQKENGLGDIDIRQIDLLKLFWEPGITDIQQSRNLFICELVDNDLLEDQYPQLAGKLTSSNMTIDVAQYLYDDTVDITDKSVVVDWYYKVASPNGRTLLHYVKFVGDSLLYASENDPAYRERGFYDHGRYPIVLDTLYPEKGTPVGFGYVSICKDPQIYIDKLSANILENSMMTTKKRFFVSASTNINEDDFLNWNKPLVRVEGELSDARVKEIICNPLDSIYVTVLNNKIEEMKDTASNRDVNSGGSAGGVTAAAAIAALQEAGNKASRDMISASYRSYTDIIDICIELIRQFYDEIRTFRITGEDGTYQFVDLTNGGLQDQVVGVDEMGQELVRRPIFDIKIKAQKKNPFSRMEQNETAKELYSMGFFAPEQAQSAMIALDMMDFEGIEDVKAKVIQGQTLLNMVQQLSQENAMLKLMTGMVPGGSPAPAGPGGAVPAPAASQPAPTPPAPSDTLGARTKDSIMGSRVPQSGYTQRIVERSKPNMAVSPRSATPGL